ncbi:hypothetical protein BO71DRAFT_413897 [Aspergillus ellipticus CBS 707.79]|uniref:Mitochondrial intermembrane space import and assembly protein 40 n=1 Tax=Aspergillus ellipticus CBS 707.79 TaxID=1448320 RepID=A0A319CW34_9EURO|nr:hypothetical protein BO71DRAFT_413897 [Aspergillus ellipticus CBS 707.79]
MFRPASRAVLRAPAVAVRGPASRRLISTTPADSKSRSWKNSAVRLGLAVGAVYYYNTSPYFAQNPTFSFRPQPQSDATDEEKLLTLESVKPKIREQRAPAPAAATPAPQDAEPEEISVKTPADLQQEADEQGAFNPETGEINWDCPCLGGMAHGPCGEEFRAAFSCFVYSPEEPKGIDCIDKFQGMQNCFREHPDVYGSELDDDEAGPGPDDAVTLTAAEVDAASHPDEKHARAQEVNAQTKQEIANAGELAESESLVPKAAHDAAEK